MHDWHLQDWLLIAQALTDHAGPEIDSHRDRRCCELAELIAAEQGLSLTEAVRQTDPEYWRSRT